MSKSLTLETVRQALRGQAAAFRCVTEYQPAGGPGDKIFPPTYVRDKRIEYAVEQRWIDGEEVNCVLLDSVQSQANRMELALLDAMEREELQLPCVRVRIEGEGILKPISVTSLDAPHRIADAIFRDSELNEEPFRQSEIGRVLDYTAVDNAAPLFGVCPTALVFGLWDSTGPRGGLGAKFQRALVSEITGLHAVQGIKTSSRIDPLGIMRNAGPIDKLSTGTWKFKDKPKWKPNTNKIKDQEAPSAVVHGNIPPTISDGGFTISKAIQTTVLSLPTLRRLRFPLEQLKNTQEETDLAARTVLAAIGLAAGTLVRAQGADLRSRCHLVPTTPFVWELLDEPGHPPVEYQLSREDALAMLREACDSARAQGLPWLGNTVELRPSANLLELVRRSQELATMYGSEGD